MVNDTQIMFHTFRGLSAAIWRLSQKCSFTKSVHSSVDVIFRLQHYRYQFYWNIERIDHRYISSTDGRERKISNLTGQVGDTRQNYSSNNNQLGGWYNQRKDQYKGRNHQKIGRGGWGCREKRRGYNGNSGRGYIQPKEIIKDEYCCSCGWRQTIKAINVSDGSKVMS